jgi:hypothetical protein
MMTYLKNMRNFDPVDSSLNQQLNDSLMYLENTHLDICFDVKIIPGGA